MNDGQVIHVAYAEDHIAVRKGIIAALERLGGVCIDIEAGDGAELLAKLRATDDLPDICIIDISMPVMDGFTLLAQIKRYWPTMSVLVLTVSTDELKVIRMIKIGANGYLVKSCEPEEIKRALQHIYLTGYYYSQVAGRSLFASVHNNAVKPVSLTDIEQEFLKLTCTELSYQEIADKMHRSFRSVDGYRRRVSEKLNIDTRVGLAIYAIRSGLVQIDNN